MKKILAFVLSLTVILGLAFSAFADPADTPTNGTITIKNATKVTDDNQTVNYEAYRIFDANPSGKFYDSGSDDTSGVTNLYNGMVGYTADKTQKEAVEGSGLFEFTLIASTSGTSNKKWAVALVEGKTAADVSQWFNTNKETLKGALGSYKAAAPAVTGTSGTGKATAVFSDLAFGYYFISSTIGSVVSIDTTNYNVVIEDKNTYGDPFTPDEGSKVKGVKAVNGTANTKYATGDTIPEGYAVGDYKQVSAGIGDVLTYEVGVQTSNFVTKTVDGKSTTEKVTYVFVSDTLGEGLDYEVSATYPFTVKIGGVFATEFASDATADAKKVNSATAPKYSIEWTYPAGTADADKTPANATGFTITAPWLDANGNAAFASGTVVTVEYSAKLNEKVDVVSGTTAGANAKNDATVKYNSTSGTELPPDGPNSGTATTATSGTEKVYVYALAIKKVDKADLSKSLEGATFNVSYKSGSEDILVKATFDEATGRYVVDSESGTNAFVTDEDGQIIIYGVRANQYTLTETVAPEGYILLKDPVTLDPITVETTTTTTTISTTKTFVQDPSGTYYKNASGTYVLIGTETVAADQRYAISSSGTSGTVIVDTTSGSVVAIIVENAQGHELPSTGGIGTTIFYIVGGLMAAGAGVVLVTKKRMGKEDI